MTKNIESHGQEGMENHVKVDSRHKLWVMLNGKAVTVVFSVLSFLIGAVAAGEHFRTSVTYRIESLEAWERSEESRLERIEQRHLELMEEINQNHLDDLNFQKEMMGEVKARSGPEVIMRYYQPPKNGRRKGEVKK